MARRRNETKQQAGSAVRWWWLALPALGLAAYLAFDATLGLVGRDDAKRDAPPGVLDAVGGGAAPAGVAAPAPVPVPEADLAPVAAPEIAPSLAPVPSATPPAQRADAAEAKKPAPKGKAKAPEESLTERDKRALEQVLDRAAQQGTR